MHATTSAGDTPCETQGTSADPLTELIQQGAGRRTIAAELRISDYQAGKQVDPQKNGDGS
jgi:hypothetical protein